MNQSISYLSGPVTDALGWTLLHAVWQGFVLVLPVAVGMYLLRTQSSALRYRLGVLALVAQVLASLVTFFWYYEPAISSAVGQSPSYSAQTLYVRWQTMTQALPWHEQVQQYLQIHLNQFVLLYLIGAALFALRLAGAWLYVQRITHTAIQPASEQVTALAQSIHSIMEIKLVVQIYQSTRITVPMVVGTVKPVLLLPVSIITNLSAREVEAVLAHELAHVKRHDYTVNLLQSVVEVLYFFHPALWWLSARIREEREHCCDDLAVQTIGGDGRTLAQALAHVEELRLLSTQSPALAMAFATRRQQLLHRVRRMLGVPTRPIVSNGSLAGLTLATLLLVSASVYAIQHDKQPKPKPPTSKAHSARRHKAGNGTEFTVTDNRKISHVVWKGQKLPTAQVTRLQRQFEQIMAGQLSLDDVKQPDRDILLTIIETNHGFESGMDALAEGLGHIDYNNIVASAVEVTDSVLLNGQWTQAAMANPFVNKPFLSSDTTKQRAVQQRLDSLMAQMNRIMSERKNAMDKVSKEMAALATKNYDFQKQMAPFRDLQRQQATKMAELGRQQAHVSTELARLSRNNDAKSKAQQRKLEAEQERLRRQMDVQGKQLEKATQQVGPLSEKFGPTQERMAKLADSISRLYAPLTALSEEISTLSEQISEEAQEQAEAAMEQADDTFEDVDPSANAPGRPARAPRPPRPPKPAPVGRPGTPVLPPVPANVARPATPTVPVAPPATPRPAPKPKVAPVPK